MNSRNKLLSASPSTPKRRRLGIRRNVRLSQLSIENIKLNTPKHLQINSRVKENCDSPPLPCNQVEYLCDSESNSSISSDIPCSPGILETCNIFHNLSSWKSFQETKSPQNDAASVSTIVDEVFNDSFQSKSFLNCVQELPKNQNYQDEIEKTFNEINQSICQNDSFFDEKDSFLLDIRESGIINDKNAREKELPQPNVNKGISNDFYGLPMITKGLFKSYRNIEKFYDWQEECLNLNAIKERRNLIYALPTSGGKTLVAEVLMLREVLVQKKNALFILPFVAIVQEKIWSLSPFAIQLDFLVEEYAAGKGHLPPKKRRKRNSIYVATIEKGLALIRSLIELDRLTEIGLIVVDELHLIGEPGRGGTLETLLSTVIFANKGIQIVAMSATIGNLPDLAQFLQAEVYQRDFRPVELTEYVKLGNVLHKIVWDKGGMELVPDRQLAFDYCDLDEEGAQTARILGITEVNAIRMMTGKPITNVSEQVLNRFYLALMLRDLWKLTPVPVVADKYNVSRGLVQSVMTSSSSLASSAARLCECLSVEPFWQFHALFHELGLRLRNCAVPELEQLMELPAVKKARALQLYRAGYRRVEQIARASSEELAASVPHLAHTAAKHLISAARMMLIEKVENLRAEAEDVMEDLKLDDRLNII